MKLVILKRNEILYKWNVDQILRSLKNNFDNFPRSAIRFRITKEPENKILYSLRIKKGEMLTLNDITKRLKFSFSKMIEEFKTETIHTK